VGTEEGKIHKCSLAYSGQYQETYKGHLLAVYKVRWNNYHPNTFISASADWTVRIWDATYPNSQVMLFDMGMIVVDAMWAPYSSTVFACATLDRIYVYDLNIEKHKSLADKKPVKNPKLTNLAFNATDPIILLGDTFGGITVIKLSPNLLKRGPEIKKKDEANPKNVPPPPTEQEIVEFEKKKMDDLISLVSKWGRE
jgi:dynein intermediate chain 1